MTDLEAARRERDEARAEMRRLREDREAFALACVHTERERGREALAAATSRAEEAEERTREATRAWFAARRDAAAGRSILAEVVALRAVEREARGAVRALGGPDHLREALATLDRLRKEGP